MKKIIIIGQKFEQSTKLQYILDNIENCQIHYTNIEDTLLDQIKQIQTNQRNDLTNIIYEIKKSNNQLQENAISQLKKANRLITKICLLSDDQANEEGNRIKNQLFRYLNVQIYNLVDYFKQNYDYDKHIDLNGNQIAMFISKEQDIKNQIFQTLKSPAILYNKWALINTPQYCINSDVELKIETINQFSKIFNKYQKQISLLFLIVDQERNDIVKQNFMDLFTQLKKFKQKIIVLLYNRFDENFEENTNLNNYFLNVVKIRKVYSLSNSQLQNQQQINEYFNKILEEQQDNLEIGIDMKDTIFEIQDETQSELEKHTFEQDFYKNKLQQLKQSVDQDEQQIILYKQNNEEYYKKIAENNKKIDEFERSKYQQQYQIREIEREVIQKQNKIDKIQKETQIYQQNQREQKIEQQQHSQIENENQVIINIKDSQTIKQYISDLERDKQSLNQKIQECYNKLDRINSNEYWKKSQEQEQQLNSQIDGHWKKIEEIDSKIREYNKQLEQQQQDMKKDNQKFQQRNNQGKFGNINNTNQISKGQKYK